MIKKVTSNILKYPSGYEPDYIIPKEYCEYRFALGKHGTNPLVVICMNPSAAKENSSDYTINRIINISKLLDMDGWMVFNLYPERATNSDLLEEYNSEIGKKNIQEIRKYLVENNIKEVLVAWGDDKGNETLKKGKEEINNMLNSENIKEYYYGTLTKSENPRHPLQRNEKWDFTKKNYL